MEYNGNDRAANVRQRRKEIAERLEMYGGQETDDEPPDDGEDEEEDE